MRNYLLPDIVPSYTMSLAKLMLNEVSTFPMTVSISRMR